MDPLTIGLITAGVTLLGGLLTNVFNRRNVSETNQTNQQSVESTNQANRLLAEQQHTWNVQDWNMQNAYDSPQAQMQRFKDAGLNPALIYGQMSQSPSVNSVNMPEMQYNKAIPFLASNPAEHLDPLTLAQIENIKANTEKTKSETKGKEIQNTIDEMNARAFETFFKQNENDIVRTMEEELGIRHNEFVASNREMFESAWDFSIYYGVTLRDAINAGNFQGDADDWENILTDISEKRFDKAEQMFIGSRDAQISANSAMIALHKANELRQENNGRILENLIRISKDNKHPLEKAGAQVALAGIFIAGNNFNIPTPNFSFTRASHSHNTNVDARGSRARYTDVYNK